MTEPDLTDDWSIPVTPPLARTAAPHPPVSPHDRLFRHLETRATADQRHDAQEQAAAALRAAAGELKLWQQLTRLTGARVVVQTGNIRISGRLASSYTDFLVVSCDSGWTHLIRLDAGTTIATPPGAVPAGPVAAGNLARRYRLQVAALELERRREPVRVVLAGGALATGTIDQVGRDHIQLAEHALGETRRPHTVTARRYLPLSAVALISFRPPPG